MASTFYGDARIVGCINKTKGSAMANPFTAHPQSVGESYVEHLATAVGFATWMVVGAAVCLVHALLPFAFTRSGSAIITRLHDRMVANRAR